MDVDEARGMESFVAYSWPRPDMTTLKNGNGKRPTRVEIKWNLFCRQCSLRSHVPVPLRVAGGMICCVAKTEAT